MIALVVGSQFFLSGLEQFLPGALMTAAWWLGGFLVVAATYRIESYFVRKGRLHR